MLVKSLGMMVHFKTRNRGAAPGGPAGGFCWVYGRYDDWGAFEDEVTRHFRRHFRYDIVGCEDQQEIAGAPANPSAASLVGALDQFPIQYRTMHLYTADEA